MAQQSEFLTIVDEEAQRHATRKTLFTRLERLIGKPVVTFYTSFVHSGVSIDPADADMLETTLQDLDLSKGLVLIINSPGGDGLAAERIIKICRSYSSTGDYWVIVPSKAKSAATIVSFGASKIYAGPTSELGPVDPQTWLVEDGQPKYYALSNLVKSYDDLFKKAVNDKKGNLEPYLQQLSSYSPKDIKEYRMAIDLASDMAVQALKTGMMKGQSEATIKKNIKMFLSPAITKTHGRPIFREEARQCGLIVEDLKVTDEIWKLARALHIRTDNFVSTRAAKCVESAKQSFSMPAPQ